MEWKISDWPSFSHVEITLHENDEDECTLSINQTNLPKCVDDKRKLENGWRQ